VVSTITYSFSSATNSKPDDPIYGIFLTPEENRKRVREEEERGRFWKEEERVEWELTKERFEEGEEKKRRGGEREGFSSGFGDCGGEF